MSSHYSPFIIISFAFRVSRLPALHMPLFLFSSITRTRWPVLPDPRSSTANNRCRDPQMATTLHKLITSSADVYALVSELIVACWNVRNHACITRLCHMPCHVMQVRMYSMYEFVQFVDQPICISLGHSYVVYNAYPFLRCRTGVTKHICKLNIWG